MSAIAVDLVAKIKSSETRVCSPGESDTHLARIVDVDSESLQRGRQPHQVVEDPVTRRPAQPVLEHDLTALRSVVVLDSPHGGGELGSVNQDRQLHMETERADIEV